MSIGPWQIILVVVLIVLLFGRGKISELMGDVAKGIKSFKAGIKDDEQNETAEQPRSIDHDQSTASTTTTQSEKTSAS